LLNSFSKAPNSNFVRIAIFRDTTLDLQKNRKLDYDKAEALCKISMACYSILEIYPIMFDPAFCVSGTYMGTGVKV